MKIASLFCAVALLASPASVAFAKPDKKAHAHMTHKRVHAVRAAKPAQPKDPYAAYWNDPNRSGPFTYRGDYR